MVVNTLTSTEKQARLEAIDTHMQSIVESMRAQWNGEAYLIHVKVISYFGKVDTSAIAVLKVPKLYTVPIYVIMLFVTCMSVIWSFYVHSYALPIIVIPIATIIAYMISKIGENNVVASPTTLVVNGKMMLWQNVFKCYVVQVFEGKKEKQLLYVFDEDGVLSTHDINGIDKHKVSHLVASYLQAYNKEAV